MKRSTKNAIATYGLDRCKRAYHLNHVDGEGASTVGIYLGMTTRQADAAINAGRELAKLAVAVEIRSRYIA